MWSDRMYYYPVQETFRYHFMESPRHHPNESSDVKGIMKRGNPFQDRSASRLSPMNAQSRKNERAELDYRVAPDTVLADAPFGTNKTPNIQMRIVGGRYIPVIEQQPRFKDEYVERRIQPLNPITLPPQQTDPRNSLDVNYYKDAKDFFRNDDEEEEERPYTYDPTALVNKRPDSKDIARLQYRTLPPIQLNRTRNDMSTVFEAEAWTRNQQPTLARETEYKQNYNPMFDEDQKMEYYQQQKPSSSAIHVSKEEEKELFKTLPRNVLLPVDSIKLTREQEHTACKLVCRDLRDFDPRELRDVYIECSQHDRDLDGFCTIEVLDNCLRRHRANLSDTLRIIAAQFVDPRQPGKVNYEKILSFIGSALEMHRKGQLSDDKPRYYMQNGDDGVKTGSIYKDREVAKLLRMVEQELSKSTYTMDWTKWQNLFYEKDRDHRETLSGPQIKDICYDCHLPLSDSLINQILSLCEDNNRDGQYRWPAFLDFLSRVRPSNTGLPIPVSKRPLEYAKHYPTPVANWPRTDADAVERRDGYSPRREPSPRRGEYYKPEPKQPQYDERYMNPDPYDRAMRAWAQPDRYEQQQYRNSPSVQRPYGDDPYRRRDDRPVEREDRIRQLSKELEQLQSKYEFTRESLKSTEKPWLDRYLKLAQALYNIDIHNSGCLPRTDVMDIVRQYNDAYNLQLDMTRANMLAISPENLDRSGNVLLRPFLANLCGDNFKQRI